MSVAKVFQSGNSQAVRIPREFRIASDEVEILRRGDEIVLRERPLSLELAFQLLAEMPGDFFADGREQPEDRKRPGL